MSGKLEDCEGLDEAQLQRIKQQQMMIEQQRQEELLRLQQTALVEKQREEEELFRLQQEALMEKQREDLRRKQIASGRNDSSSDMKKDNQFRGPASVAMPPPPGIEPLAIAVQMNGSNSTIKSKEVEKVSSVEKVDNEDDLKLPVALEQAFAFKCERAKQVGIQPEEMDKIEAGEIPEAPPAPVISRSGLETIYDMADEDDEDQAIEEERSDAQTEQPQQEKDKKTRRKKKKKKKTRKHIQPPDKKHSDRRKRRNEETGEKETDVEIEYIQETLGINELDPMYKQFARIFETFRISEPIKQEEIKHITAEDSLKDLELKKLTRLDEEFDDLDDMEEEIEKKEESEKPKLSKRKIKKLTRLSVAELKQLVHRPDVVEMHDVTARDPKLLVQLKAHRNTVPVPRHWCFKRKYLQGKRGIEKPPFDLPEFIKKTGIMEMRAALQEKEDQRTLKAKMRERARPKLGKIDIDYQKLHDAFFKWQTKPRMSIHGDLYYEGKEFETRLREKKPGDLSDELRTALGMPVGPSAHKVPPPWLIAMQRYGPPPSYPTLKIPGLNCPIPEGCSFGYHAGGWGKPPVDETGKPLYGDVFGVQGDEFKAPVIEEEVDRTPWGELESESEEESEEEEEEEEEVVKEDETGLVTPAEGLVTPSGITSIPAGLETPEIIELRKKKIESEMEGNETPVLYQVLPEKRLDRVGAGMMASTHIYDIASAAPPPVSAGRRTQEGPGTVELALDPSELDLVDTDAMAVRYEQQIREQQSQLQKEDLSDMLADHVARQKNKRKQRQQHQDKQAKKYKEFKF